MTLRNPQTTAVRHIAKSQLQARGEILITPRAIAGVPDSQVLRAAADLLDSGRAKLEFGRIVPA